MNIDQEVFRMVRVSEKTNPVDGHVYWSWKKSIRTIKPELDSEINLSK